MAQTFTSTDVVFTTNVFADNQSQRTNENTLRSTFSGSTQPSDPVVGQQWYDTANSKTMQYNGTAWVPVDTNGTTQVDVSNAKGSLTSLTSYLRVAHNDDGTLKTTPASSIDEFKDNALVITYLSPTSFTVPSDLTSIFTANRKVKVYLSASTAISYVVSSTFSTVTTVTLGTPVLDATVTAVKYSIIQDGERQDTVHAADLSPYALLDSPVFTGTPTAPTATIGTDTTQIATTAFVAAAAAAAAANGGANSPGYFSRDIPFYASNKLTIATPNRLWVNIAKKGYMLEAQKTFDISADASWDSAATLWQANHDYAVNDVIYPSATKTGYYYRCTTAGKSSAIAPTFPTTLGSTYNDGNVVWVCELDFTVAANRAGKDFYIYACVPTSGTVPTIVLSANSTVPSGYTATNSRKIGGFHCLCADVGTISGHALSGYIAGDILPASAWDLLHRPKCDPEGMAYNAGTDMWNMIYLASWTGTTAANTLKLVSKFGAVTADGASTEKFHWYKFADAMSQQNMRHPWHREFMAYARGSNQGTAIKGAADTNTTGGHVDTAGRRMISTDGLEDCCGFLWQWIEDTGSASSGSWTGAYDANDFSDIRGSSNTTPYKGLAGGDWGHSPYCGSRCSAWNHGALDLFGNIGARGASEPRKT